jgi:predicted dehydrogenase
MTSVRGLPDLYEVAGIAEADNARWSSAEKASAYQGLKRVSEAELISDKGVAVVVVETAIEDSVSAAMRCLEAGKHIHLDKPGLSSTPISNGCAP